MSLLFSSHLLPDVEAVCEYVMVLGRGRLLIQGRIEELERSHQREFELRVKGDHAAFSGRLGALGIPSEPLDDHLLVRLPAGREPRAIWEAAREAGEQVRAFRPRRSTLEEVFLDALGGRR